MQKLRLNLRCLLLPALAALIAAPFGCGNDVLRVEQDGSAVSAYSTRSSDAGVDTASVSDAGPTHRLCSADSDCDDGNPCNGAEQCVEDYCRPGTPLCFDGDPCTKDSCDRETGQCSFDPAADGSPCADGNLCDGQICMAGTCVAGPAPVCATEANRCIVHACDPATGECLTTVLPDGASCADGDACNGAEVCSNGECIAGPPLGCDDHNPCTADSCDPVAGCINVNVADGSACPDGNLCNGNETCVAGVCQPGPALTCDDDNPCTLDTCVPATGACTFAPLANGVPCPDGDLCDGQTCNNGSCVAGHPVVCATDNDGNPCTANLCQPATGMCAASSVADGTPCGDGNLCNGAEACYSGVCSASSGPLVCPDDGNPCTTSVCNPSAGCIVLNVPDGTSCADSDLCNGTETCHAGLCTVGTAVSCVAPQVCNPSTGSCGS